MDQQTQLKIQMAEKKLERLAQEEEVLRLKLEHLEIAENGADDSIPNDLSEPPPVATSVATEVESINTPLSLPDPWDLPDKERAAHRAALGAALDAADAACDAAANAKAEQEARFETKVSAMTAEFKASSKTVRKGMKRRHDKEKAYTLFEKLARKIAILEDERDSDSDSSDDEDSAAVAAKLLESDSSDDEDSAARIPNTRLESDSD